jgi:hypothetical protein
MFHEYGLRASWTNIATARDGVRGSSYRVGRTRLTLSTPSPGKPACAGLPVLILTIPNNPILQSRTQPDRNYGATLARTRMCVHMKESITPAARHIAGASPCAWRRSLGMLEFHLFPSNLHVRGTDGDAPV